MNFFNMFFKKRAVGIDIGTDSIKVVEISARGSRKKLENYGQAQSNLISKEPLLRTDEKGNLVSSNQISLALKEIFREAKIKTKKAVFCLPDFLTLAAFFEIPPMSQKEIPGAVHYNASQYLTLPVSEVTLDWMMIPQPSGGSSVKSSMTKIFLIAVPNQVIQEYEKISASAGLKLYALEAEVFSMARALVKNSQNAVCLIDMGAKTSTINIVDKGFLRRSYSFDFGGNQLSLALSSALGVEVKEAEAIKVKEGILSKKEQAARALKSLTDPLFAEVKNICGDFSKQKQGQVKEFYLTGGTASLPGLKEYFEENFKNAAHIPDCFLDFSSPKILQESLKEMAPRFSASVGAALVEFGE